jgi:hypothetical protein
MKTFLNFITENNNDDVELTSEEIDNMVDNMKWEDIEDLYEDEDFDNKIEEAISAAERIKMGQRMRSKKYVLAMARRVKLKRTSSMPVLQKRAKLAARKLILKRLLQKKKKTNLSAQDKNMIELKTKRILATYKNLPQRMLPKIRELEKQRLSSR